MDKTLKLILKEEQKQTKLLEKILKNIECTKSVKSNPVGEPIDRASGAYDHTYFQKIPRHAHYLPEHMQILGDVND